MFQRLLVGLDGSAVGRLAFERALELAGLTGASLTLLHAFDDPIPSWADPESLPYRTGLYRDLGALGQELLEGAAAEARQRGVAVAIRLERQVSPADALVAASAEHDLLVLGSHGRRGFARLVMGSVAEAVARRAQASVLIVKPAPASP